MLLKPPLYGLQIRHRFHSYRLSLLGDFSLSRFESCVSLSVSFYAWPSLPWCFLNPWFGTEYIWYRTCGNGSPLPTPVLSPSALSNSPAVPIQVLSRSLGYPNQQHIGRSAVQLVCIMYTMGCMYGPLDSCLSQRGHNALLISVPYALLPWPTWPLLSIIYFFISINHSIYAILLPPTRLSLFLPNRSSRTQH